MENTASKISVSHHQERLWFIDQFEKGNLYEASPVYHNIPLLLDLQGPLDVELLTKSIAGVISRHETLRTRIVTEENNPVQFIYNSSQFELELIKAEADKAVEEAIKASRAPFDLENDPLIRGRLYKLGSQHHILSLDLHHAIADKQSLNLLTKAIFEAYEKPDQKASPSNEELQYADFAHWQKNLPRETIDYMLFYWKNQLQGKLEDLTLPTDKPRAGVHIFEEGRSIFMLEQRLSSRVRELCENKNIPERDFFLTAFKVLLHKYTNQTEINVGISAANRNQPETRNIIGPMANLLPLRDNIDPALSFDQIIKQLGNTVQKALEFQEIPFDRLVQEVNPQKDMSRTALFDVLFQYERAAPVIWSRDIQVSTIETNLGWGKYDFNLLITSDEKQYQGILTYNQLYFDHSTADGFTAHFAELVKSICNNSSKPVAELSFITAQEQHQILEVWNNTGAEYPKGKTIYQLFAEYAGRFSSETALIYRAEQVSYEQLQKQTGAIGKYLKDHYKIEPNDRIAVMMDKTDALIAVLLGVLRAGGAYLPIDPQYPEDRIHYMLADSQCKLVIANEVHRQKIGAAENIIEAEELMKLDYSSSTPDVEEYATTNHPEDTAYIIYTSGTTGKPKGCMVSHKNVIRLLHNDNNRFDFTHEDTWIMAHSYCFDFSVWEMYGALLYGGKLVIPTWEEVRDISRFAEVLKEQRVTVLNQTPRAFYNLIAIEKEQTEHALSSHLRYVIFGGDKLEVSALQDWVSYYPLSEVKLINMFGITETTVHVTFYQLQGQDLESKISPIGGPLPETTVYVMDEQLRLVPPGIFGELCVGGTGVSKGYLHREELTNEKFVTNPYNPQEKIYRSGDVGRWLPGGRLEYLGRRDHQVKVRGFRIELGEIESVLLKHEAVKEAVIAVRQHPVTHENDIVAYIVPEGEVFEESLKDHLNNFLPGYMIPALFVKLENIPLTSNGKVNRKALPDPKDQIDGAKEFETPVTETEKMLVKIWQQVLLKEKISALDNFFEIGGHSLKATVLVSSIYKECGIKLEIQSIFLHPVLRDLARLISSSNAGTFQKIPAIAPAAHYPLSHAQRRLWILDQMEKDQTSYNMTSAYQFKGALDLSALEKAFIALIRRHESLRTTFGVFKGVPAQVVHETINFNPEINETSLGRSQEELKALVRQIADTPFDLSEGPLIRCKIHKTDEQSYLMILSMHHIISDGWSMEVLFKEVISLYNSFGNGGGDALKSLRVHYKDYAAWEANQFKGENLKKYQDYWRNKFRGDIQPVELPIGLEEQNSTEIEGAELHFMLDSGTTQQLQELAQNNGASLFMVLLAFTKVLLYKYSGQEDIIVASPIAGRVHPDLEEQIGLFINTLALKTKVHGINTFEEVLESVKQTTLEAYEHQLYPFDELMEMLEKEHEGKLTLNNVWVQFRDNAIMEALELPGVEISEFNMEQSAPKNALTFDFLQVADGLRVIIRYKTSMLDKPTVELMRTNFQHLIETVLADADGVTIAELELQETKEAAEEADEFLKEMFNI